MDRLGSRANEDPQVGVVEPRMLGFRVLGHALQFRTKQNELRKLCFACLTTQGHTLAQQLARLPACPFRKSYPDVLVVQSSQDRNGDNGARALPRKLLAGKRLGVGAQQEAAPHGASHIKVVAPHEDSLRPDC